MFGPVNRNALQAVLTSHRHRFAEKSHAFKVLVLIARPGSASASGWGDDCKFRADRAGGVDAKGVEKVVIRTGAGDMKVVGRGNAARIEARGVACAAKQELLDAAQINVRREGDVTCTSKPTCRRTKPAGPLLTTNTPTSTSGLRCRPAFPSTLSTSSGDAAFEDLKSLTLQDSSGDLAIDRIAELAHVADSSGDIDIDGVGSVRLRDSSGNVEVNEVRGDVDVIVDSSAISASRGSTAASRCSRTAPATSAWKTSRATSRWTRTAPAISMPAASTATSR